MTPDKTLEELARLIYEAVVSCPHDISRDEVILKRDQRQPHSDNAHAQLFDRIKSATAAQQREVERLQALLKESVAQELPRLEEAQLIYRVAALEEQLRTERERAASLVESAWREGLSTGHCTDNYFPDEWWPRSKAFTALSHSGKEGV